MRYYRMGRMIFEMGFGKAVSAYAAHSTIYCFASVGTDSRVALMSLSPFSLLDYEIDPISLK
jgi:hypothetical protein